MTQTQTGFCRPINTTAELDLPNAWLRSVASGNHSLLNRLYSAQTQDICKLKSKRLHMKRQKINCSGNRSRRKPSGKKPLFLNLGKEVLSVYQRNDHPPKNNFLPHKYIQDIQIPSCPTEAGNTMMAGLWKMLSQDPPKLLLLPNCSRPQQGKFLIQEDLIWPYTMAEALAQ